MSFQNESILTEAWSALGGDPAPSNTIHVIGNSAGLLPSTYRALPAMVAAVAASTLAASFLDGSRQQAALRPVVIDVEHVAVAAQSERFSRTIGSPAAMMFAPLSRFWRTGDGWIRLHANYDWHRDRALKVLDCEDRPDLVANAIESWQGDDLEESLAAAGALGSVVRTRSEWHNHPQGQAVEALPLLVPTSGLSEGRPIGAGRFATNIRVLDLTRVIAGPVATRTLSGWGADVLRIDSPHLAEIPAQAQDTLPGKRSAHLDFAQRSARLRLEELLAKADVLVQGYRPGALTRFGCGPDDLAVRHPHLTVITISAWGEMGPWAARRGFDSLVQCSTGIAAAEGDGSSPGVLPAQVLDHATGYLAAAAALLSLSAVSNGRSPISTRLSLAQTARWLTGHGTTIRELSRPVDAERFLIDLGGAERPVRVIRPPGRIGDTRPFWNSTTELGADNPAFLTRGRGIE